MLSTCGRRVTLIGHSLGGLQAHTVARHQAEQFASDCVIRQAVRDFGVLRGKIEDYCACSRISFDLRAPEKLRFGSEQPLFGLISPSEARSVPFAALSAKRHVRQASRSPCIAWGAGDTR